MPIKLYFLHNAILPALKLRTLKMHMPAQKRVGSCEKAMTPGQCGHHRTLSLARAAGCRLYYSYGPDDQNDNTT